MIASRRWWLLWICVWASTTAVAQNLPVQNANYQRFSLEIQPQPLESALNEFSRQTHLRVSFYADLGRGLTSSLVVGSLTPDAALRLLLAHTGLQFKYLDPQSIAILPDSIAPSSVKSGPGLGPQSADETTVTKPTYAKISQSLMPAAEQDQATSPQKVSSQSKHPPSQDEPDLSEIVVTGSRIAHTSNEGAQDVKVYKKELLEQSGQTNVADFLNTLPSVSQSNTDSALGSVGGTTVSLRGLPLGTTLVLINGRRVETSGSQSILGDYFDLNNIPVAAVERIEVIADGSSAIYGSDAIGGVVNIILRKDLDGIEVGAKQSHANGIDETNVNAAFGKRFQSGSLSIVGSYQARGELDGSERTRVASNDYTRFGGPNRNQNVCSPANVFSLPGGALPGGPAEGAATYAALQANPHGGNPSLSDFRFNTLNQCGALQGYSLIPSSHRAGIFVQGSVDLAPTIQLFTELMYSRVTQDTHQGFSALFGQPGFQSFTLGAANPFNPFGEDVGLAVHLVGVPVNYHLDTNFYRALLGLTGTISNDWHWEVSAWDSMDSSVNNTSGGQNSTALQQALNSSDPNMALNPFTSALPVSPNLVQQIFPDSVGKYWGRDQSVNAYLSGAAFELPAGPLKVVLGGEYDRNHIASDIIFSPYYPPNLRSDYDRTSYAAFAEARVPIIPSAYREPMLAATLAVRRDHFSDFGGTTNPQYGVEFHPVEALLIRATYAKSFKAPPLTNLYQPVNVASQPLTDPRTGLTVSVPVASGGNPMLGPIEGRSYTYGLVWTVNPDLRASVTNWNIQERDLIEFTSAQFIVDNDTLYPGRVTRDANGQIVGVNASAVNLGSIGVAGVDYSVGYHKHTDFGDWSPSLTVTQVYHYVSQTNAGSPPINGLSEANDSLNWTPRLKGTVALGWSRGPISATVLGRYVGKYQDYDIVRETGNYWVSDANVKFNFGAELTTQALRGSFLEVGAINVFNRSPQYSSIYTNLLGYDATQEDIRGRVLYVQLGSKW